jgi:hypothetical protein
MSLSLILFLGQMLMRKFSNPVFHLFIRPIGLSLIIGIPLIFREGSADFGMKSSGDILRGSLSAWDEGGHDPMTSKRNLHSLAALLLVRGRSACLFFGQMRVHHATLLPEVNKSRIHVTIPDFKWQSLKDNFDDLIFSVDKMVAFGIS